MNKLTVVAKNIGKDFNRRPIFRDISFSLSTGDSLAITGRNGSGKSTLSKIIAGVLSATRGEIEYVINGQPLDGNVTQDSIGFVSPYLNLYDEFTAFENLQLLSNIRASENASDDRIVELLSMVQLWSRRNDLVGEFSSGMKQRLKYAFALLHRPQVLILDEPTSNLDEDGVELVCWIVKNQKNEGILIVATNDKLEAKWCKKKIVLKGSGESMSSGIS